MCLGMLRSMSGILTLIGIDSFDIRLCLMCACVCFVFFKFLGDK